MHISESYKTETLLRIYGKYLVRYIYKYFFFLNSKIAIVLTICWSFRKSQRLILFIMLAIVFIRVYRPWKKNNKNLTAPVENQRTNDMKRCVRGDGETNRIK